MLLWTTFVLVFTCLLSSHEKILLSRLLELVNGILDSVRNYLKSKKSDKENQGGRKDGKKKKVLSMFAMLYN